MSPGLLTPLRGPCTIDGVRALGIFVLTAILSGARAASAEPPRATVVEAAPEREGGGTMLAGQILTGIGAASVLGGGVTAIVGATTNGCRWGGVDCSSGVDVRLTLIGAGILLAGGAVGLGVGIPLWVKGAESRSQGLTLEAIVYPTGGAGLRAIF